MTRKQNNALKWFLSSGDYRPIIGGLRHLEAIELQNKDTGETEKFDIKDLVAEYDQYLKEERRAKASAKRLEKK